MDERFAVVLRQLTQKANGLATLVAAVEDDLSELYRKPTKKDFEHQWKEFEKKYHSKSHLIKYLESNWIGTNSKQARYPPENWAWFSHSDHKEWETETTNNIAERFMRDLKDSVGLDRTLLDVLEKLQELMDFWIKEIIRLAHNLVKPSRGNLYCQANLSLSRKESICVSCDCYTLTKKPRSKEFNFKRSEQSEEDWQIKEDRSQQEF